MILTKNPKMRTECNEVKTLMLNHSFELRQIPTKGCWYNGRWTENKVEVAVIKTSKGEYSHPVDMNAEMAKRFERLAKLCNETDGGNHSSNKRATALQQMYSRFKSMPVADVKKERTRLRKATNADEPKDKYGRYCASYCEIQRDELYVIENLLNIR